MLRALATIVIAALSTSAFATERQANYTKQYACAAEHFAAAGAVQEATDQAAAAKAAEACVTSASLAVEYKGYVKYEERNPDTLAKELAERRNLVAGALVHYVSQCRKKYLGGGPSLQACVREK